MMGISNVYCLCMQKPSIVHLPFIFFVLKVFQKCRQNLENIYWKLIQSMQTSLCCQRSVVTVSGWSCVMLSTTTTHSCYYWPCILTHSSSPTKAVILFLILFLISSSSLSYATEKWCNEVVWEFLKNSIYSQHFLKEN